MSIHYRQYTDTFSILNLVNYLQNHCLWRKKRSKVGPILSRKFQITYKIIVCGEKTVKIGTILSRKSSKEPSWLTMCSVYIRNELPTGLPARFNAIQHKGDILPIRTCAQTLHSRIRFAPSSVECRPWHWLTWRESARCLLGHLHWRPWPAKTRARIQSCIQLRMNVGDRTYQLDYVSGNVLSLAESFYHPTMS